jgi:hypothetical protein
MIIPIAIYFVIGLIWAVTIRLKCGDIPMPIGAYLTLSLVWPISLLVGIFHLLNKIKI